MKFYVKGIFYFRDETNEREGSSSVGKRANDRNNNFVRSEKRMNNSFLPRDGLKRKGTKTKRCSRG